MKKTLAVLLTVAVASGLAGCSKPTRQITSSPVGARVTFNGSYVGVTPTMEKEPPYGQKCWSDGNYALELAGYKPFSRWKAGSCEPMQLNFPLEKLTEITLDLTSNPPEANIQYVKDMKKLNEAVSLGVAPVHLMKNDAKTEVKPTWAKGFFRATMKGYRNQVVAVEEKGESYKVHFDMVPLPKFPEPPVAFYPSPESVIITPVMLDQNKDQMLVIDPSKTLAIYLFKEPEGSGAGSLVADSLILNLRNRGYRVVDRDAIDKALREQGMIADRKTLTEDNEVMSKIGKITNADYFIMGAITDYSAKSETVNISPIVLDSEKERYTKQMNEYLDYYASQGEQPPAEPRSLQSWEMEYASKPKSYYISIARVGVTAKMIDVGTSRIVWVGIGNASDMRLQEDVKRIANAMIDDFTGTKTSTPLAEVRK